jgi:hypothetical protein
MLKKFHFNRLKICGKKENQLDAEEKKKERSNTNQAKLPKK